MTQLQMRMLRPAPINAGTLTSNVPETGTEYSAAAVYAKGDVAIATAADGLKHRYESLVAGNVGKALTDTIKWLDLGATNRWAMFDNVNGTRTEAGAGIDAKVAVTGRADGLALLNLTAEQVQVTVTAPGYGTVYDETHSLVSVENINNWYAYFSEDVVYIEDLVVTNLPLVSNPSIRVQIGADSGNVAVGTAIVGQLRELGMTLQGVSAGIQDYSRKETDDFGNKVVVERAYSKRATFKLVADNGVIDGVFRLLSQYRAKPVMWIGSDLYAMTSIYGFARDWNVEIAFPTQSYVSLDIEGLT